MNADSLILVCSKCNGKNRVPVSRLNEKAKCGNGKIIDKLIGALPKEQLESQIARIL